MDYAKLGPELVAAVDDQRRLVPAARQTARRVVVFLRCAEDAAFEHLAASGVRVNQARGRVRTGVVPLDALDRLTEDAAVDRVVAARRLRPLMDVAPERVGVPSFRRSSGLTGAGVVVGVVDSGVQPDHPDFGGRVMRIWDQTVPGPGVAEGGYGMELTKPTREACRDVAGHGTHVAGIAAGEDPVFTGVAPATELVAVKTDLLDAHVADGIRYVFRIASELGRPAVVNLSVGGQHDAHDGTDPLSAVVDAESGPGRIVCCAAGNEGTDDIHARTLVGGACVRSVTFTIPRPADGSPGPAVDLQGWYGSGSQLEVAVASPAGPQTPFQGVIAEGSPVGTYSLPEGEVRLVTPGLDPANGDHNFLVQIQPAAAAVGTSASGAWRLRLRRPAPVAGGEGDGDVPVDVWALSDGWAAQFTGPSVHDGCKVGTPGAASQAVTVASFTTRVEWYDLMGGGHQAGLELDDVSDFSSEGPRRDGAPKPDVAAPGAMIVSALSYDTPVLLDVLVDGFHQIMAGTSMATPFVSGLVALLLERDPTLDPDGVKQLLTAGAAVPGQEPGAFDPKWGHGLVDAETL